MAHRTPRLTQRTWLAVWVVLLVGVGCAFDETGLRSDAEALIFSWESAVEATDGVWAGFDLASIPTVLGSINRGGGLEAAVAFNHPAVDALGTGEPVERKGASVVAFEHVERPQWVTSRAPYEFTADLGGISTLVVVGYHADAGVEPGDPGFIALLAHEAFHRHQIDTWAPSSTVQDVDGYDYSARNLELVLLESRVLVEASLAERFGLEAELHRYARQFVAVRNLRQQLDARVAHDHAQERIEGSARFIEHRIGDHIGSDFNMGSFPVALESDLDATTHFDSLEGCVKELFGFARFYGSGAAVLGILDDLGVERVAERLATGASPAALLAEALAPLSSTTELVTQARKEHDPNGELPARAAALAETAANETPWDGTLSCAGFAY